MFTGARVKNMLERTKKKDKTLGNFKQNQQCSLPQVEHLRGDNIFHFM